MPCDSNAVRTSGEARISLSSLFTRATNSGEVPGGAKMPYHMSTLTLPAFASTSVGTWGNKGWRRSLPIASATSLPALTCGSAT